MEVVGKLKSGLVHWNHENLWYLAGSFDMKKMSKRCHNSYSTPSWLKKMKTLARNVSCLVWKGIAHSHFVTCMRPIRLCLKDATKVSPSDDFLWYTKNARSAVIRRSKFQSHTDSWQPFFGTCLQLRVQTLPLRSLTSERRCSKSRSFSTGPAIFWPWNTGDVPHLWDTTLNWTPPGKPAKVKRSMAQTNTKR